MKDQMEATAIIVRQDISLEDLEDICFALEKACGGKKIEINPVFDLTVSDPRQAEALKILFSTTPVVVEKEKPRKVGKRGGARSYTVEGTGEVMSAVVAKKKVQAGELVYGTVLVSSSGRKFKVTDNKFTPVV